MSLAQLLVVFLWQKHFFMTSVEEQRYSKKKLFFLSLAALGVVYGDIGTSPLYAINEIFYGHAKAHIARLDILGSISLVIWALTIVIAIKYITFVLRADNDGEGGVFALYGLVSKLKITNKIIYTVILIIAAGLLFGDGIITPAISVISSVEGLRVAFPSLSSLVVPLTICILTFLFFIQKKGTQKVGTIFGPLIFVWFCTIALLGIKQITIEPQIVYSFNPIFALNYLTTHSIYTIFLTMGAVMLVITGGEAMYADMGHFGRKPIRLTWFLVVYPSLILTYMGQGAYMLSGQFVKEGNIFYSMVPAWALLPMIAIATCATIIASQALISGSFSLAKQAISFNLLPFIKVVHTHHEHEGQIYIPFVNWALYTGCVLLVIFLKSSNNLASAYGLAVSGCELVTSLTMFQIARNYWRWNVVKTSLLFVPLALIDLFFLSANSLKLIDGGYIPISIALAILFIMTTWRWGRANITKVFNNYPRITLKKLIKIKRENPIIVPRSIIIMTPDPVINMNDKIPPLKQMVLERNGVLSRDIIFVTVNITKDPHVHKERYIVKKLYTDKQKGSIVSVIINFGYMEEPDVESMLEGLARHHKINVDEDYSKWIIYVMQERVSLKNGANLIKGIRFSLFNFLQKNTYTADHYFNLGEKQPLSIEAISVKIS